MPSKKGPAKSAQAVLEPILPGVNPAADHDKPDESLPFPIVAVGDIGGTRIACGVIGRATPFP